MPVTPKQLLFDQHAREEILKGVNLLARAVKATLGPKGRNVGFQSHFGSPILTKDGVTVANEIDIRDPFQNMGVQMVKEVAAKTADVAGDGTTTATVLAQAIYAEGMKLVAAGHDPMGLKRGIDRGVTAVTTALVALSRPTTSTAEIANIATISANGDTAIGTLIAEAMEKAGKEGVVTIEESGGLETRLSAVEGLEFPRGYLSAHFVTDHDKALATLHLPYVLLCEQEITNAKDLEPILVQVAKTNRPILIIANDVDGTALATLVLNKINGKLRSCAVRSPAFGHRRKDLLEDIAVLTGAKLFSEELRTDLKQLKLADLGEAHLAKVSFETTTIVSDASRRDAVATRIEHITQQIAHSTSDLEKDELKARLATLAGGVVVVHVGAATEPELKEKKMRVDDALCATRAAMAEGIVPGGGVALVRCQAALNTVDVVSDAERCGLNILRTAMEEPLRQIAVNAGVSGEVVLHHVKQQVGNYGYDAQRECYGDMVTMGIIDPTKVVRVALQNAASVAGLMITTEALIVPEPLPDAPKK